MKRIVVLAAFMLAVGLLTALYLVQQPQILQNRAASGEIDTLDYFVSDHAVGKSANPKTLQITQYVVGNSSFFAKNDNQYEYHTWDNNYIYLKQDASTTTSDLQGKTVSSYKMPDGIWMKRFMKLGERIEVRPNLVWYSPDCQPVLPWPTWYYFVSLERRIPDYNAGGDLGKQDVIVMVFDYITGTEKFFYSKEWGWIRWEEWKDDKLVKASNFNQITDRFYKVRAKCGTPQPNITIPSNTPTQAPSQAPTQTPIPGQSRTPTPTPPPNNNQNASCPSATNPVCFDCNKDSTVNILDFSCFTNFYGDSY